MQANIRSRGATPHGAADVLRRRAATARRLARDVSMRDSERLQEIAAELDARAVALDTAETDEPGSHGSIAGGQTTDCRPHSRPH